MSEETLSRRDFVARALALGMMAAGGATLLGACKSGGSGGGETEGLNCNNTWDMPSGEVAQRNALHYVEQTANPAQRCDNCQQWQAPAQANTCGRCLVVPGPINPAGHCDSWVAQAQTPGTGAGTGA